MEMALSCGDPECPSTLPIANKTSWTGKVEAPFVFLLFARRFTPSFTPTPMAGASINLNPKAKAEGFTARFVCLKGKT
ncbi:MAG: hypothetical protein KDB88_07885, partial [Flavobacteriales bacterium]|nr:hypothetical protein [Flavobacteriales bacterium]